MEGINHSSRKITDIIGVIDSIAFQTNILALDGSRGGRACRASRGRGFPWWRPEVRSLASSSAEAARRVRQLIADSMRPRWAADRGRWHVGPPCGVTGRRGGDADHRGDQRDASQTQGAASPRIDTVRGRGWTMTAAGTQPWSSGRLLPRIAACASRPHV